MLISLFAAAICRFSPQTLPSCRDAITPLLPCALLSGASDAMSARCTWRVAVLGAHVARRTRAVRDECALTPPDAVVAALCCAPCRDATALFQRHDAVCRRARSRAAPCRHFRRAIDIAAAAIDYFRCLMHAALPLLRRSPADFRRRFRCRRFRRDVLCAAAISPLAIFFAAMLPPLRHYCHFIFASFY
jgi:hypothetical protein